MLLLNFINLAALFFLLLSLFLFYRHPSCCSSQNMAEGSPKSIYDFTVKVYALFGFICSSVWFIFMKVEGKIQFFIACCFWTLSCSVIWFHIWNTHLLFLFSLPVSWGKIQFLLRAIWFHICSTHLLCLFSLPICWGKIQCLLHVAFELWLLALFGFIFLIPTCCFDFFSWKLNRRFNF